MKRSAARVIALLSVCAALGVGPQPPDPIRLHLQLAKTKLQVGEYPWYRLSVSNIGRKPIALDSFFCRQSELHTPDDGKIFGWVTIQIADRSGHLIASDGSGSHPHYWTNECGATTGCPCSATGGGLSLEGGETFDATASIVGPVDEERGKRRSMFDDYTFSLHPRPAPIGDPRQVGWPIDTSSPAQRRALAAQWKLAVEREGYLLGDAVFTSPMTGSGSPYTGYPKALYPGYRIFDGMTVEKPGRYRMRVVYRPFGEDMNYESIRKKWMQADGEQDDIRGWPKETRQFDYASNWVDFELEPAPFPEHLFARRRSSDPCTKAIDCWMRRALRDSRIWQGDRSDKTTREPRYRIPLECRSSSGEIPPAAAVMRHAMEDGSTFKLINLLWGDDRDAALRQAGFHPPQNDAAFVLLLRRMRRRSTNVARASQAVPRMIAEALVQDERAKQDVSRAFLRAMRRNGDIAEAMRSEKISDQEVSALIEEWVSSNTLDAATLYFADNSTAPSPGWLEADPKPLKTYAAAWSGLPACLAHWKSDGYEPVEFPRNKPAELLVRHLSDASAYARMALFFCFDNMPDSRGARIQNAPMAVPPSKKDFATGARKAGRKETQWPPAFKNLYEDGGLIADVRRDSRDAHHKLSIKVYTLKDTDGALTNMIGIADITNPSRVYAPVYFPMSVSGRKYFRLYRGLDNGKTAENEYELRVGPDGAVIILRPNTEFNEGQISVFARESLAMLRAEQVADVGTVTTVNGRNYYVFGQGGAEGSYLFFEKCLIDARDNIGDMTHLLPAAMALGVERKDAPGAAARVHAMELGSFPNAVMGAFRRYRLLWDSTRRQWTIRRDNSARGAFLNKLFGRGK